MAYVKVDIFICFSVIYKAPTNYFYKINTFFRLGLYHPNRDNEVISVEGREAVAHTEHGRGAEHQG